MRRGRAIALKEKSPKPRTLNLKLSTALSAKSAAPPGAWLQVLSAGGDLSGPAKTTSALTDDKFLDGGVGVVGLESRGFGGIGRIFVGPLGSSVFTVAGVWACLRHASCSLLFEGLTSSLARQKRPSQEVDSISGIKHEATGRCSSLNPMLPKGTGPEMVLTRPTCLNIFWSPLAPRSWDQNQFGHPRVPAKRSNVAKRAANLLAACC